MVTENVNGLRLHVLSIVFTVFCFTSRVKEYIQVATGKRARA